MTEQEYRAKVIAIWDSLRDKGVYCGAESCAGVNCENCPFSDGYVCIAADALWAMHVAKIVEDYKLPEGGYKSTDCVDAGAYIEVRLAAPEEIEKGKSDE